VFRKRRALPVTKIYMPDFRHAHTLQQSVLEFRVPPRVSIIHKTPTNPQRQHKTKKQTQLLHSQQRTKIRRRTINHPGLIICIVVVCGHDESPAYISWLRAEPFFFWSLFSCFFKKWPKVSKSMTHLHDFLKKWSKATPNREIIAKTLQKLTHGRAGGSLLCWPPRDPWKSDQIHPKSWKSNPKLRKVPRFRKSWTFPNDSRTFQELFSPLL